MSTLFAVLYGLFVGAVLGYRAGCRVTRRRHAEKRDRVS